MTCPKNLDTRQDQPSPREPSKPSHNFTSTTYTPA